MNTPHPVHAMDEGELPEEGRCPDIPHGRPHHYQMDLVKAQLWRCAMALKLARQDLAAQEKQLAILKVNYDQWHQDMDLLKQLTFYITQHYSEDRAAGRHAGLTVPQIIIRYLDKERSQAALIEQWKERQSRRWTSRLARWFRDLFGEEEQPR